MKQLWLVRFYFYFQFGTILHIYIRDCFTFFYSTRYVEIQAEGSNEKSKFWNLFSGLFATRKREDTGSISEDRRTKKLPDSNEFA